jgi:hypothetical protein
MYAKWKNKLLLARFAFRNIISKILVVATLVAALAGRLPFYYRVKPANNGYPLAESFPSRSNPEKAKQDPVPSGTGSLRYQS